MVIGKIRGYQSSEKLNNFKNASVKELNKLEQLFAMLKKGKIDLLLDNPLVIKSKYKMLFPSDPFLFENLGSDFQDDPNRVSGTLHIAWTRKKEGIEKVVEDFERGLKMIKKEGIYKKIIKEYERI